MADEIVNVCGTKTASCDDFMQVDDLMLQLVSEHYFDLQMYANFVFEIDNDPTELSSENNFQTKIIRVQTKYNPKYPSMPLFTTNNMAKLETVVDTILKKMPNVKTTAEQYASDLNLNQVEFFGSGAASPTILLKIYRRVSNGLMPLIVKFVPLEMPHQYKYLHLSNQKQFIKMYIESPGYALFLKEAWMYCFSKEELAKYTPTFTCIANCLIIDGFPFDLNTITKMYQPFYEKRVNANKSLPYKKWFNILLENKKPELIQALLNAKYGCFEMQQIDGTLEDIVGKPKEINLSIIFEYLYTKIVAAYIGRIIFTDDHFGNVAFITVDYVREYEIKCNGLNYHFYMPPGKMVQFIDLERYVFNFSQYDIYTNTAFKSIPDSDYQTATPQFNRVKSSYLKNNYIFDKSLSALLDKSFNENNFEDESEYVIMLKILTSKFVHDIKTFCQIMFTNLPAKYQIKPTDTNTKIITYNLDLDDNSIRIIDQIAVEKNI